VTAGQDCPPPQIFACGWCKSGFPLSPPPIPCGVANADSYPTPICRSPPLTISTTFLLAVSRFFSKVPLSFFSRTQSFFPPASHRMVLSSLDTTLQDLTAPFPTFGTPSRDHPPFQSTVQGFCFFICPPFFPFIQPRITLKEEQEASLPPQSSPSATDSDFQEPRGAISVPPSRKYR